MRELPPLTIKVQGKRYPVEGYADASEKVLAALEQYARTGGRFSELPVIGLYSGKNKIGHVSTNGKVWQRMGGKDCQVWPPKADAQPLVITQPPAGTVAAAMQAKVAP